jgi:hypothetical protein
MDLKDAIEKARYILKEEEKSPTLDYRYDSDEWPPELKWDTALREQFAGKGRFAGPIALSRMRARSPREVFEQPDQWNLESTNYGPLLELYSQLLPSARETFVAGLLNVFSRAHVPFSGNKHFSAWKGHSSALPLLAEFSVRNGHWSLLLRVIAQIDLPNANLISMMLQLQETVSLNFNLFTEAELKDMPESLKGLRQMAENLTWQSKRVVGTTKMVDNRNYKSGFSTEGRTLVEAVDAFLEECRKAHYFYVKGSLQQSRNPEIESDKAAVLGYLEKLGFSATMVEALNAAERYYRDSANAFDLKSCLGIVRSFYEHLHVDAGQAIAKSENVTVISEWDPTITFLRNRSHITLQQEKFARGLYTLLSDEGVHALVAEREFARLLRNMVIEYGVMFLSVLDKKGVRII